MAVGAIRFQFAALTAGDIALLQRLVDQTYGELCPELHELLSLRLTQAWLDSVRGDPHDSSLLWWPELRRAEAQLAWRRTLTAMQLYRQPVAQRLLEGLGRCMVCDSSVI